VKIIKRLVTIVLLAFLMIGLASLVGLPAALPSARP
jgi:hypothetical protein